MFGEIAVWVGAVTSGSQFGLRELGDVSGLVVGASVASKRVICCAKVARQKMSFC